MTEERALTTRTEQTGIVDPSQYPADRFNVLAPISILREEVPYLRQSIATVKLDPNHEGGDCYAAPGTRWMKDAKGNFVPASVSPAKAGLLKIAAAMGIVFQVEDVEPPSHRLLKLTAGLAPDIAREIIDRVKYDTAKRCRIAVRDGSGWRYLQATYVWDLDAQRRKVVRDAKKRAEKAAQKKPPETFDVDEYVEDRMDQIIAERDGLAETKAVLRAIRATGIKHAYTREEFSRPFVVQRTDLFLDVNDPATRAALAQKALASSNEIFGGESTYPALASSVEAGPDWKVAEAEGAVLDLPPIDPGEEVVEPLALPEGDDTPGPWDQPQAPASVEVTQDQAIETVTALWKMCGALVKTGDMESMPPLPPAPTASVPDLMKWATDVQVFVQAEKKAAQERKQGGAQ